MTQVPTATVPNSNLKRLTFDGRLKFSPVFHPNGQELIYVDFETPSLFRLQRLNLESGIVSHLHPAAKTSELEPNISFSGDRYCYLQTNGPLVLSAVTRTWNGSIVGEVPPPPGFAGYRSPVPHVSSDRIIYSFADGGRQQIFSSRVDGSDRQTLVDSPGINNWPHLSPDGSRLVFGSSREGNFEIYSATADGGNLRRLTESPRQDIRPRFSPDGSRIVFTSCRDGNAQIYLMNADGTGQTRVTDHAERDDFPTWHPDGRQIAFVGERGGWHDLYLINCPVGS